MNTLKVSKDSKGYLQPTIEGAATIEEHEALKAAHQVRIQQKTNGHIARLQDERHSHDHLIRMHAAALVEIEQLKESLKRTGSELMSAIFVCQQIGVQNRERQGKVKKAHKSHERSNRAWAIAYKWLEANKSNLVDRTNKDVAFSVEGIKVAIDKGFEGDLTLDVLSRAIGEWRRGIWEHPKE